MTDLSRAGQPRGQLLRDAVLTFTAVLIAFAAFDDITTDNATTFTFEWLGLGICAAWLLVVSWRLVRGEQRWLGSVSVIALIGAVGAGSTIRPGTGPDRVESLATIAGLVWFLGLRWDSGNSSVVVAATSGGLASGWSQRRRLSLAADGARWNHERPR